ncbi:MAG: hypothetical protein IKM39_03325, partial [Clostridia bacterium]|nr:hypothetical protein [Clostridia bacterium]
GVDYFTGLHGYASGGAYIDSYTQWELYSQKITGNKLKPQEYGPAYFENNSLIVFQGHTKTSGPVKHTVTGVTCQEDEVTITVSEVEETGRYYDMEAYENFCVVELGEKFNTWLERIRFVIEYKLEQVDSSGNLVKVVKEETMEYTYYYDIDENQWV